MGFLGTRRWISALGQTRKFLRATGKSASPSATDIVCRACQVRKVPMGNIDLASRHRRYQLTAYQGFLTSKANRTLPGRPPFPSRPIERLGKPDRILRALGNVG